MRGLSPPHIQLSSMFVCHSTSVSKHWSSSVQPLMNSCNNFDDALTVCSHTGDAKVHTCIKQLAKHKCLASTDYGACIECADSVVPKKHNHKRGCQPKEMRK